jgi:hypothetical protein
VALSTRRRDRSYPTPMAPGFDDSNRESYIARSNQGIASLPKSNVIVDYGKGKGGRDPSMIGGFGLGPMPSVTEVPTDDDRMEDILQDLFRSDEGLQAMPNPIVEPATSYLDPTADDYFLRELYNKFVNPVDPENEGLPMDEFQNYEGLPPGDGFESYDPNNPNMFMLPEGMDLDDMPMEEIIKQMQEPKLEASADTYSLPNLLQMLDDARDAGDDSYDTILEDIQLRYPGATMDVAELTDDQKNFMLSPLQNPDFQSQESLFNKVKQMEDKGFFGFGAQEPTTMEEMLEFMDSDQYKRAFI